MKKIFLLLALLLIIGCQNDFKGAFDEIEDISKDHGTSFFTEQLNKSEVPLDKIMPLIEEIEAVKVSDNASISFKEARLSMLRSQLYWQLAMDLGDVGRTEDGFACKEKPYIKKAEDYFNKTHFYGLVAYNGLDSLLVDYPEYRDVIGLGANKTQFYYSPIFWAKQRADFNRRLYDEVCNRRMNVSKNDNKIAVNDSFAIKVE